MYYINKYEDKHSLDAFIQYLRNIKRIGWAFALVAMSFRQTANVWYIEIKKKKYWSRHRHPVILSNKKILSLLFIIIPFTYLVIYLFIYFLSFRFLIKFIFTELSQGDFEYAKSGARWHLVQLVGGHCLPVFISSSCTMDQRSRSDAKRTRAI